MSHPRVVILLQARMASRRLPGKALATLGGRTILRRCLDRLRASGTAPVVLATTRRSEDDALVAEAAAAGVAAFRGPDDDVLARFVLAARGADAHVVIRATADNPAVDIDAPGRVLRTLIGTGADHVIDIGLPIGGAVEAVTLSALCQALDAAADPGDREHVTPFVRRERSGFYCVETAAPQAVRRPDLRLTVDTRDDLRFMSEVYAALPAEAGEPALADIIAAADRVARQAVAS